MTPKWYVWPLGGDEEQATIVEAWTPEEAAEEWVSDDNDQCAEYPNEREVCVRGQAPSITVTYRVTLEAVPSYHAKEIPR